MLPFSLSCDDQYKHRKVNLPIVDWFFHTLQDLGDETKPFTQWDSFHINW